MGNALPFRGHVLYSDIPDSPGYGDTLRKADESELNLYHHHCYYPIISKEIDSLLNQEALVFFSNTFFAHNNIK